jgi:hypothetical protein
LSCKTGQEPATGALCETTNRTNINSQRRRHGSPNGANFCAAQHLHSGGEKTEREYLEDVPAVSGVRRKALSKLKNRGELATAVRRDLREKLECRACDRWCGVFRNRNSSGEAFEENRPPAREPQKESTTPLLERPVQRKHRRRAGKKRKTTQKSTERRDALEEEKADRKPVV